MLAKFGPSIRGVIPASQPSKPSASLDYEGLRAYWHDHNFRIGAGLSYDPGRSDSDDDGFFSSGDSRLRGMEEISSSVEINLFASYRLGAWRLIYRHSDSTRSRADEGIMSFGAGLDLTYVLDAHWSVGGRLNAMRFEGDAAKSPLTMEAINAKLIIGLGYHF